MPPVSFREGTRELRATFAGVVTRLLGWWRLRSAPPLVLAVALLSADKNSDAPISAGSPPFGLTGIYSTDFMNFPKWRGMLARFSLQLTDAANARLWQSFRADLRVGNSLGQLRVVNAAVNSFPYVSDDLNWGKADYWETPIEFLQHAGDCEDFAITKYMTLRSLGVAAENMRVAVVTDTQLRVAHAVLLVVSGGKHYVLDNLTNEVVPATAEPLYRPVYAINEDGWWNYGPQVAGTPAGSTGLRR